MSEPGNGNTLTYRVAILERELEKLEHQWNTSFTDLRHQITTLTREVAVLATKFEDHTKHVDSRLDELEKSVVQLEGSVNEDVKGLRRVLFSVGSAVLIAAITFAITSLAVFGAPG